jgi:phenylalanyl-tRNA synthetase beta chain
LGRVYWKEQSGELCEPNRLIVTVSARKRSVGEAFYQLKHDLLNLFSKLQIDDLAWLPLDAQLKKDYQHKFVSARLVSGKSEFGAVYSFSPEFSDIFGIKEDVCIAELDFDLMFSYNKKQYFYEAPPKYPAVNFELSIMAPQRTYFESIRDIIYSVNDLVKNVEYLDSYESKDFNDHKSMSVSIEFRSADKTLEPDEVTSLQDSVVQALAGKGFKLREA